MLKLLHIDTYKKTAYIKAQDDENAENFKDHKNREVLKK